MIDFKLGYASFAPGPAQMAFAIAGDDQQALIGRHPGIGLVVDDFYQAHEAMIAAAIEFDMPPRQQPWGGVLGLFKDPDGNIFYLDQMPAHHD